MPISTRASCAQRCVLILGLGTYAASGVAQSTEGESTHVRSALSLSAPEECPSVQAVSEAVEALLERTVFGNDEPDVLVDGELERVGGGWRALLRLERADGEVVGTRELLSADTNCQGLMASLPLVLALMVDLPKAHVSLRVPVAEPENEEPAPPDPTPPDPAPPPAATPSPAPERPSFDIELGLVTSFGWLPGSAMGAVAGLGFGIGRFRVGLRGYLHPPWTAEARRGELRTWAAGGGLRGGVALIGGARGSVGGFLEVAAGRFEARSVGVREPLAARGPTVDVLGGIDAWVRLGGPWRLGLELGLGVPLVPPRFSVQVGSTRVDVFSASPVFGRVGVQIGLSTAGL